MAKDLSLGVVGTVAKDGQSNPNGTPEGGMMAFQMILTVSGLENTLKGMEQRDQQKEFLVMFQQDREKLLGQPHNHTIKHLVKFQVKQH